LIATLRAIDHGIRFELLSKSTPIPETAGFAQLWLEDPLGMLLYGGNELWRGFANQSTNPWFDRFIMKLVIEYALLAAVLGGKITLDDFKPMFKHSQEEVAKVCEGEVAKTHPVEAKNFLERRDQAVYPQVLQNIGSQ
jgi:hypothetical protein